MTLIITEAVCIVCRGPRDRGIEHAACAACHKERLKAYRKARRVSPEQSAKASARAKANVYRRRGKIKKAPCVLCGSEHSQMHHEDYSRPLDVTWLCRPCHLALHRGDVALAA